MPSMTDPSIMADKMRIGIYGGAFNPVHNGHLHLAAYFCSACQLQQLLFVPTARPPHRSDSDFAPAADRIAMLRLATAHRSDWTVSTVEFELPGKSYTYDTVCALERQYPGAALYLLVGADQFLHFDSWYKAEQLLQKVTLLGAPRQDEAQRRQMEAARSSKLFAGARVQVAAMQALPMSSSAVRQKVREGRSIADDVPAAVADYIQEKGLYRG